MEASKIGTVVQVVVGGKVSFFGILEYLTPDGWAGIRQPHDGGRLDEAPVGLVEIDPT